MSFLSFVKNKMLVVPLEESLVRSGTTSIFYKRNGHVGKDGDFPWEFYLAVGQSFLVRIKG